MADLLATRTAMYEPARAYMLRQLELGTRLAERYRATGRVGLTGPDYQLAKDGAHVMDELAAVVDRHTAIIAADWSEQRVNALANA